MNIIQRVQSPTPKFFIKLRNVSLVLATLGAGILAAPVALPAIVLQLAGYIAVAGGVGASVSQVVTGDALQTPKNEAGGTSIDERPH